ncbi:hypothetical protein AN958_01257 [Leucoagaricus sp. SymC.cos]|nr:hypothetical protein AN958_01257 [Leucoagaricus sp. SymC.cos]
MIQPLKTLHDSFGTAATGIVALNHTLQKAPIFEDFFKFTPRDSAFVDSQVGEVNTLTQQLFKYRATLLRNLNSHQSTICKLPPEILSEIFQFLCNLDSSEFMVPTEVGGICSHWRQVAWSTPHLWTDLFIERGFWKSSHREELLDLYFTNMGELLLDLIIDPPPKGSGSILKGIVFKDVFERLFVKHAQKLRSLKFGFEASLRPWLPRIEEVTQSGGELRNLEELELVNGFHTDPDLTALIMLLPEKPHTTFDNVPNLKKLVLRDISFSVSFPWAQLTELTLSGIDSGMALGIVLQCQDLVSLKLEYLSRSYLEIILPSEPLIFQHLQTMEYRSSSLSSLWERAFVKCLSFTDSLKSFTFLTEDGTPDLQFLRSLPTSITDFWLDCTGGGDNIQGLEFVLARFVSLRCLLLRLEDPMDRKVVELLSFSKERRFLPCLRSLSLVVHGKDYHQKDMDDMLNMVQSRLEKRDQDVPLDEVTFSFPNGEEYRTLAANFKAQLDKITRKDTDVYVEGQLLKQSHP